MLYIFTKFCFKILFVYKKLYNCKYNKRGWKKSLLSTNLYPQTIIGVLNMDNTIIHEIKHIVEKFPRNFSNKLTKEQRDFIENNVDPKVKDYKFSMKVYWVLHDIHEFPKCENPDCSNRITKPIISIPQGYFEFPNRYRYCSIECRCAHDENWKITHSGPQKPETVQKRIATNNKLYGGNSPFCSSKIIDKMKSTKEKRYGYSGYNNREQAEKTCEEKYGVVNVSQIEEVKKKKEDTCLKNHGVKSFFHDKNWQKQVFMNEFGVDNPMKLKKIQDKAKTTRIEKYGVEWYFQSDEYKSKISITHKNSHKKWILFWNGSNEYKIFKYKEEPIDEYNKWEHNMMFDSKSEITIFVFCALEHHMNIEYQPNIQFEYECDGKKFIYCPDFLINERLYEFKGEQFFRINESTGKEEMYMPWRSKNISDEEYIFNCRREESKHQCMLNHGVIILRENDIKNISVELFN